MGDGFDGNDWTKPAEYKSHYDWRILGYVDLTCCVIILISNALVILVLTKKKKTSPMDVIFIHIAVTESLASLFYVPHVIHEFIRATLCSIPEHRTYEWEQISLYSFLAAFLFRTTAVWLAVLLGIWRYITVLHPLKARTWCNMKTTRILITAGYIVSIIFTIPIYVSMDVGETHELMNDFGCLTTSSTANNITIYTLQLRIVNHPFWYNVMFLSYAMFQIIPSLIFAVIIGKLIVALYETKKSNREMSLKSHHYFRTTIILILIVILLAIAEIPHGIFNLLCVVHGPPFFWTIYYHYGIEICDFVIYISQSFNFIIYYSMSNEFRQTFKELFSCTKTNNNEIALKNMASAQRYVSPSSGVDKSLGIGNQSSDSRDIN